MTISFRMVLITGFLLFNIPSAIGARVLNDALVTKPFSHQVWQQVLTESVDAEGRVAWNKLKATPKKLNQYLAQLAAVSPDTDPDATTGAFQNNDERLAYWINAHNALAMRLVLDRYPVKSLTEVPHFISDRRYQFGGVPMSLQEMEAKIQGEFYGYQRGEAFFALSLMNLSAPPLANQAYQGSTLKKQLSAQAKRYFQEPAQLKPFQVGSCTGLKISPWLRQMQAGLTQAMRFQRPGRSPQEAEMLAFTVKPYLPPEQMGLMSAPCAHPMQFLPANPALRTATKL